MAKNQKVFLPDAILLILSAMESYQFGLQVLHLAHYGTGIVKCSAHDERDFEFAKKYNIPLKAVLFPEDPELRKQVENFEVCYTDMENGILTEPTPFAGKKAGDVRDTNY